MNDNTDDRKRQGQHKNHGQTETNMDRHGHNIMHKTNVTSPKMQIKVSCGLQLNNDEQGMMLINLIVS